MYAQDDRGNVWYLGEATAEYEDGEPVTTAGSFEAGIDGAQAGVIMPARPRPGLSYRQEFLRGRGRGPGPHRQPARAGRGALGPLPPGPDDPRRQPPRAGVLEFKFYARGVGPVLAVSVSGGSDREELVRFRRG